MSDPKLNTPSSSEMQIENLQSNDFSLLELFFKADAVVMLVMLSLIFLSIWCWTIIFNKYFKFRNEVKTRDNFEQYFSTSEIDHSALEKYIKEKIDSNTYNSYEIIQGTISENPYVSCEIQIVMINDKNKVKDISKILHHPFFKLT